MNIIKLKLFLLLLVCMAGCSSTKQQNEPEGQNDLVQQHEQVIQQMSTLFHDRKDSLRSFSCQNFAVLTFTDENKFSRIKRYTETLLHAMDTLFIPSEEITKVYIFDTKEDLALYLKRICGDTVKVQSNMGFYHRPSKTIVCSMEWGLGWVGDLLIRVRLNNDFMETTSVGPNKWFQLGFISLLYNSFRTPYGDFKGLNTLSYYRPIVQKTVEENKCLPLRKLLSNEYNPNRVNGDSVRRQGREFLAYLLSKDYLFDFYKNYRNTFHQDPSGISAVEKTTGTSIENVEKEWLEWLMTADGELGSSAMSKPFPVLGILMKKNQPGDREEGVTVFEVCPNSPAFRCGVLNGDRVTAIDDKKISTREELLNYLSLLTIDTTVTLELTRNNKPVEDQVKLDRLIDG